MDEKYIFTTIEDSVRDKHWAAGSSEQIESPEFVIRKVGSSFVGVHERVKYPPSLLKIVDEPIVNALDHVVRSMDAMNSAVSNVADRAYVRKIDVSIDETGLISVYNDGPGIEIELHPAASKALGRPIYVPTMLFGILFQGSNRSPPPDSIIGGTNGLGAKLPNCFSSEFTCETYSNGKYFSQRWEKGKSIEHEPVILTGAQVPAAKSHPHTRLTFRPDYELVYKYASYGELCQTFTEIVRMRVWMAAAYASFTQPSPPVVVRFNGEIVTVRGIVDIARTLFPGCPTHGCTIKPELAGGVRQHMKYPWEICVVVTNTDEYEQKQLSIVNGVVVREGRHFKDIMAKIVAGVRDKVAKIVRDKDIKFTPGFIASNITNNIFLLIDAKMPGVNWTGQRKDVVEISSTRLAGYKIPPGLTDKLATHLSDQIIANMFTSGPRKAPRTTYEHYREANWAGGKRSAEASLIMAEGVSAMSQIIIGGGGGRLNWDKYGVISLGGVIINTRKHTSVIDTVRGPVVKKTQKLEKNIFMKVLQEVTGLNPAYKYDPTSPTYARERKELLYGESIIAFVDQDHDGKGNILGLILSAIELTWPNLLRDGYVKWAISPIARAYPKRGKLVLAFYNIVEFETWTKTVDVSQYEIQYYKGIGTHSPAECKHMFKVFEQHLKTFTTGPETRELFEIYYGKDADKRKVELSKPSLEAPPEYILSSKINASEQLLYEANPYQKDNLDRKLDSCIDGQNQAGRKILNGVLAAGATGGRMKIGQLSGTISASQHYDHGEASLADTLTGKAFIAVGGKQLPFLVPLSNFGSRLEGGNDAAAPRYIYARLNRPLTRLLFNVDDYFLLPFNMVDGVPAEPKYFMPIIPLAIIESSHIPSHGWKLQAWARDVYRVITNVQRLIRLDDRAPLIHMPPATSPNSTYPWTGEIRSIRGVQYSFGKYEYAGTTLRITELPLRCWNSQYMEKMRKKIDNDKKIVVRMHPDRSDDLKIRIEFTLTPTALTELDRYADGSWSDGIEEYFCLKAPLTSHLNMMGAENEVKSFKDYEEVLHYWFPFRRSYYEARAARLEELLRLRIIRWQNVRRYIELHLEYGMSRRRKDDMIETLAAHGYNRIADNILKAPKHMATDQLRPTILDGPTATYDYIFRMTEIHKSVDGYEKVVERLEKLNAQLEDHIRMNESGRFAGAELWNSELEELKKVIADGEASRWLYGDADKFTYE